MGQLATDSQVKRIAIYPNYRYFVPLIIFSRSRASFLLDTKTLTWQLCINVEGDSILVKAKGPVRQKARVAE
jgi:hypothetical protein